MKFETNQEYKAYQDFWSRCRDCAAGGDAVKAKGEAYLPKPSKYWTDEEYKSYKMSADYINIFGRTVDTLTGLIMRIDPTIEAPAGMEGFILDSTMTGIPLVKFARRVVEEVVTVGRVGVMVDYPVFDQEGEITLAEFEALNLRPRLAMYITESIWDWKREWIGNAYVTTYVLLSESETRKKELVLIDGVYTIRMWEKEKGREEYLQVGETVPRMQGRTMDFIPFLIADPIDSTWDMDQPPLLDLADINLSHYRTLADLELGRKKTALPTFWATGVEPEDLTGGVKGQPVRLGAGAGLMTNKTDARFGLLEFTGQGLGALERADQQKRDAMSALGASVITGSDSANQSGIALELRREGETASLSSISWAISETLTRAMIISRDWYGLNGVTFIRLNTEFFRRQANPQELALIMGQVQSGTTSSRTLWEYMQKNGVLPNDKTYEQNQEELETDIDNIARGIV